MSKPKFTPGPWIIERKGIIGPQFSTDDQSNAMVKELCDTSHCWENREANSHLIAAAPDLYESLNELAAILNGDGRTYVQEALERADAALDKARGEA